MQLEVGADARRRLAEAGYEPAFGARPLRRAIQRMIQDPLALQLLDGTFAPGDRIVADVEEDGIAFRREESADAGIPVSR